MLYSSGYDPTILNGARVPGASKVGQEMSAAVLYGRGPFSIGVTYDQLQGTSVATQSNTQSRALFGASYDFGIVKAFAGVRWFNTRNTVAPPGSMQYWGGLTYRVSAPFCISTSLYHTQSLNQHGRPTMGVLLVDYFLSKRTERCAEGAYVNNRSSQTLAFAVRVSSSLREPVRRA